MATAEVFALKAVDEVCLPFSGRSIIGLTLMNLKKQEVQFLVRLLTWPNFLNYLTVILF